MKKPILIILLGASMMYYSCETRPGRDDAVTRAKDINQERFEDTEGAADLSDEATTLVDIASSNMLKMRLSERALERASSREVQQYAERVAQEQRRINQELQELAAEKNITLPLDVSEDHRDSMNDVLEQTGMDFDQEYINLMTDEANNKMDDLEDLAENSEDEQIRNWAARTIPTVRQHQEIGERIKDQIDDGVFDGADDILDGDDADRQRDQDRMQRDDDRRQRGQEDDNDGVFN
jgi:putative membrane protein